MLSSAVVRRLRASSASRAAAKSQVGQKLSWQVDCFREFESGGVEGQKGEFIS